MGTKYFLHITNPTGMRQSLALQLTSSNRLVKSSAQSWARYPGEEDLGPIRSSQLIVCAHQSPNSTTSSPESQRVFEIQVADDIQLTVGGIQVQNAIFPPHIRFDIDGHSAEIRHHKSATILGSGVPDGCPWVTSAAMGDEFLKKIYRGAKTELSIFLSGETGSGKELIAQTIHAWSLRAKGPLITINCAAIPEGLAESELFGHSKGAFTGAHKDRLGALLQAHRGTLFLDEIADLSLDIQAKLLRFLESGELRAVGSDRCQHSSVRVVSATHKNLAELVREGRFRRDLYYRIASIPFQVPALRERVGDIVYLAEHFSSQMGLSIHANALDELKLMPWPGNVRQLRHCIERAAAELRPGEVALRAENFYFLQELAALDKPSGQQTLNLDHLGYSLHDAERFALVRALQMSKGHRDRAAKILGVSRSTVFDMLERHKLKVERTVSRIIN